MGRLLGFVWDGLQIIRCDLCVQYLRVWLFCVLWILLSWADALPSLWIKRLVVCRLGDDVHFFYTVFDLDWDPICKTSDWSDISNLLTWLGSDFLDSIWKRQKIDFGWLSLVVWSQAHRVFEQDTGPQVAPALFSVVVKVEQGLIRSVSSYLNLCANKHLPVSWCLALMIFFVERERGSKQSHREVDTIEGLSLSESYIKCRTHVVRELLDPAGGAGRRGDGEGCRHHLV